MSGGVMTFTVIDATKHELLGRLVKSITGDPAVFEAASSDDPSVTPEQHHFEVRVQKLHMDDIPVYADVLDQYGRWFQIVLHDDTNGRIEFEIITT